MYKKKFKELMFFVICLFSVSVYATEINDSNIGSQNHIHKPPILTTAAIIEVYKNNDFQGIVLIERGKAPWGKALPGGKVEYGETVENAIRREMKEEVNLDLYDLQQFHVYSDPKRDFRHHSVEVTYLAKAFHKPKAGDDAAEAWITKIADIPWDNLAFDHALILRDYLKYKEGKHSRIMPINNMDKPNEYNLIIEPKQNDCIPSYLYKILSLENWEQSQSQSFIILPKMDKKFIHLAKKDQLDKIKKKYWSNESEYIVLKIDTTQILGKLIYETNPGKSNKYYHIYDGSIPLKSIVKSSLIKN